MGKATDKYNRKWREEQDWVAENKDYINGQFDKLDDPDVSELEKKATIAKLNKEGYLGEQPDTIMEGILKWFS